MALVTIATIQADSTIAVAVAKDFLKRRGVDISAISTQAQAKAALEAELRQFIKQTVVDQRMDDDATTARATSQTTNSAAVVLA